MSESSTLVFTGDIGFDKYMDGKWDDPNLISKELTEYLHSADHVIANVEGPLVEHDLISAEGVTQLLHSMDPKATRVLHNMNADIWNLCNNHMMDAGELGVQKTLEEAAKCGALTIGAGMDLAQARKPVILDDAGGIGIFAVGYRRGCKPADENKAGCYMWHEMDMIRESIRQIKEKCRWCVMVVHGGEEFTALPHPYTRNRYLEYLNMGADIVVSHHPHVPMNYEIVGEKAIFYSLGNFIFDTDYQRAQLYTEQGILLKLSFTEKEYRFEAKGILIDRETETIVEGKMPEIFVDVQPEEYEKLIPLSAKAFVSATKRQQIYLNKDKFANASEEDWAEHFANPKRSGRVEGEGLDFFEILPLSEKEKEKAWESSKLESVKQFILRLL